MTELAASTTLAFDVSAKLLDAVACAAAVLVDVAGPARVTAAVVRAVVDEAIVRAMDDLQVGVNLSAVGRNVLIAALSAVVTRSAKRHRGGPRLSLLATEGRRNDGGDRGAEAAQHVAP
jgi:hypothetical protein